METSSMSEPSRCPKCYGIPGTSCSHVPQPPPPSRAEELGQRIIGLLKLGHAGPGGALLGELILYAREQETLVCHHGWRGGMPRDGRHIVTPCPACGGQLFIADGGHLTCASVPKNQFQGCHSPSVEETVGALKKRAEELKSKLERICDECRRKILG